MQGPWINVSTWTLIAAAYMTPAALPGQGDADKKAEKPAAQARDKAAAKTIVVATRLEERELNVPFSVSTIDARELRRRSYRTTPQALRDVPGVMIQETAHGHGSPYIRGFTSFRNLFLIDGIRLNNSVFRQGPNQYWNTVDPFSLQRLEVVKGPSSVLYGSDAIGGTVQALTKDPDAVEGDGDWGYAGESYFRYASAENSVQARGEISFGYGWGDGMRTGALLGGSFKNFGDLEGGDGVGLQRGTGYEDLGGDVKIQHDFDDDTRLVFLHQRVRQDDVPRTHRTTRGLTWRGLSSGSDQQRNFDQERCLTYLQFHKEGMEGALSTLRASLSWHEQDEVRDRIRGNGNQEFTGFDVATLGAWAQLESQSAFGRWTYGFEYYRDNVDSFLNRLGNGSAADAIQGPIADDATYDMLGVYVQNQFDVSEDLQLKLGGRFTYAAAESDSVRDPLTNLRTSIDEDWDAFVGSARFLYRLDPERTHIFGGIAQGFRAPNLSDLTRFGTARSGEFEVPTPNLDPEDYLTYEIGVKVETDALSLQAAYFYTDIEDQILRSLTGNQNGAGENEVTKQNVGDGHIDGVEFGAAYRATDDWTIFGNATYTHGRVSNFDGNATTPQRSFITRLMPFTAQIGVRWEDAEQPWYAETRVIHAENQDKLSFGDQRDTSRIPPGGTPGYTIWNLQGGWKVSPRSTIHVLLENVTDVDYRVHGSGLNRPGRNFIVSFATRF